MANKVRNRNGTPYDFEDGIKVKGQLLDDLLLNKQDLLISGQNLKTVGGISLLGQGDIGNLGSDGITLVGSPQINPTQTNTYTISNYDSFETYVITADAGQLTLNGQTFNLFAPANISATSINIVITKGSITKTYTISVGAAYVNTPLITSPTQGQLNFNVTGPFTTNAFSTTPTNVDQHELTDWQFSLSADFSTILYQSTGNTQALTSYSPPSNVLPYSTVMYVRARHRGLIRGYSAWSDARQFTTRPEITVNTPSINSPSAGQTNFPVTGPFVSSAFATTNGSDTHLSSDWQFSTNSSFTAIVHQSTNNTQALTSYSPPTGQLSNSTVYYVRVRHKGTIAGDSAWSAGRQFTTIPPLSVNTPSISSPTTGATGTARTLTVTASAFGVQNGTDTHASSTWQFSTVTDFSSVFHESIANATSKTSYTVPAGALNAGTQYYVRVKYIGASGVSSSYSNAVNFTTLQTGTPSITSPASNATNVDPLATFTSSAFSSTGTDTHLSSDWQFSTVINFSSIAHDSIANTSSKTSYVPPANALNFETTYYVRVRHTGSEGGSGNFSTPVLFTVRAAVTTNAPTVTSPLNNATGVTVTPTITTAAYSTTNGSDTHAGSDWQIATNTTFTNIVYQSINSSSNLTSLSVPAGNLSSDTVYYLRVRHRGAISGYGAYSSTVMFTTLKTNTPSITNPANNSTNVSVTPTFTSSAYSSTGTDTHQYSTWQVATDSAFSNIVQQSVNSTVNKTSFTVGSNLSFLTVYYVRVKHTGTIAGDSAWSASYSITTQAANGSVWLKPTQGYFATNSQEFNFTDGAFHPDGTMMFLGGTGINTDFAIYTESGGVSLIPSEVKTSGVRSVIHDGVNFRAADSNGVVYRFDNAGNFISSVTSGATNVSQLFKSSTGALYILSRGGNILRSNNDGVNWTTVYTSSLTLKKIVENNGIMLVLIDSVTDTTDSSQFVVRSTDGVTWSPIVTANQLIRGQEDIFVAGGKFWVIGKFNPDFNGGNSSTQGSHIFYSSTGLAGDWLNQQLPNNIRVYLSTSSSSEFDFYNHDFFYGFVMAGSLYLFARQTYWRTVFGSSVVKSSFADVGQEAKILLLKFSDFSNGLKNYSVLNTVLLPDFLTRTNSAVYNKRLVANSDTVVIFSAPGALSLKKKALFTPTVASRPVPLESVYSYVSGRYYENTSLLSSYNDSYFNYVSLIYGDDIVNLYDNADSDPSQAIFSSGDFATQTNWRYVGGQRTFWKKELQWYRKRNLIFKDKIFSSSDQYRIGYKKFRQEAQNFTGINESADDWFFYSPTFIDIGNDRLDIFNLTRPSQDSFSAANGLGVAKQMTTSDGSNFITNIVAITTLGHTGGTLFSRFILTDITYESGTFYSVIISFNNNTGTPQYNIVNATSTSGTNWTTNGVLQTTTNLLTFANNTVDTFRNFNAYIAKGNGLFARISAASDAIQVSSSITGARTSNLTSALGPGRKFVDIVFFRGYFYITLEVERNQGSLQAILTTTDFVTYIEIPIPAALLSSGIGYNETSGYPWASKIYSEINIFRDSLLITFSRFNSAAGYSAKSTVVLGDTTGEFAFYPVKLNDKINTLTYNASKQKTYTGSSRGNALIIKQDLTAISGSVPNDACFEVNCFTEISEVGGYNYMVACTSSGAFALTSETPMRWTHIVASGFRSIKRLVKFYTGVYIMFQPTFSHNYMYYLKGDSLSGSFTEIDKLSYGAVLIDQTLSDTRFSAVKNDGCVSNDGDFIVIQQNGFIFSITSVSGGNTIIHNSGVTTPLYSIAKNTVAHIVVGENVILRKTTGTNWTAVKALTSPLRSVRFINGRFIAVGDLGVIYTSDDNGLTWVLRDAGTITNLGDVTYFPEISRYLIGGDNQKYLTAY